MAYVMGSQMSLHDAHAAGRLNLVNAAGTQ
jgi:hypothetical protein